LHNLRRVLRENRIMQSKQNMSRTVARLVVAAADMAVLALSMYVSSRVCHLHLTHPEEGVPQWLHMAIPFFLLFLLLYVVSARRKRCGVTWRRIVLRAVQTASYFAPSFIIVAFLIDNAWLSRSFMWLTYGIFILLLPAERLVSHKILLRRRSLFKGARCIALRVWDVVIGALFILVPFPFLCIAMAVVLKRKHVGAILTTEERQRPDSTPFKALVFNSPDEGWERDLPMLVNVFMGHISFSCFLSIVFYTTDNN